MADTKYDNPHTPVSAINIQHSAFNIQHSKAPLHIEAYVLCPHSAEFASLDQLLELLRGGVARAFADGLEVAALHEFMLLEVLCQATQDWRGVSV